MALDSVLSGAFPLYLAAEFADRLPDGCEIWKEIGGYRAWTTSEQIQVVAEHAARVGNWMQSQDGTKDRNRPKPLDPPKGRYEEEIKTDQLYDRVKRHEARRQERIERLTKQAQEQQN